MVQVPLLLGFNRLSLLHLLYHIQIVLNLVQIFNRVLPQPEPLAHEALIVNHFA